MSWKSSHADASSSDRSVPETNHSLRSLVCYVRDAVVTITSLHGHNIVTGMGFLINRHFIMCAAQNVIAADRICVTVPNIQGITYVYDADIVGVHELSQIAVLRTREKLPAEHAHLAWGKSRNMSPGDKILLIGDMNTADTGITVATVTHNRYTSRMNEVYGELLLVSHTSGVAGIPVLDMHGKIVGMTTNHAHLALSEYFMRRPVSAIISACVNGPEHKYREFIAEDDYYHFTHAILGVKGHLVSAEDLIHIDTSYREIMGYYITRGVQDIQPGDIITHLNVPDPKNANHYTTYALGNCKGQISPAFVMCRLPRSTKVTVTYRKISEAYAHPRSLECDTLPTPSLDILF